MVSFLEEGKMGVELSVSDAQQKWYMCKFKKDILSMRTTGAVEKA